MFPFQPVSNVPLDVILLFYSLHLFHLFQSCTVQRPQPVLCHTMHSKQSIKTEAPPQMPVSAM